MNEEQLAAMFGPNWPAMRERSLTDPLLHSCLVIISSLQASLEVADKELVSRGRLARTLSRSGVPVPVKVRHKHRGEVAYFAGYNPSTPSIKSPLWEFIVQYLDGSRDSDFCADWDPIDDAGRVISWPERNGGAGY